MKADVQPTFASFASFSLKLAGLLLILGVLVDYFAVTIPPNFLDSAWLANLISEWVGRGTIPLIGIALILFGVWVGQGGGTEGRKSADRGWLQLSLIVAGVLGVVFLFSAPIYFRSNQLASAAETRQVNEAAAAAEQQLNAQLEAQREQVSAVVSNQDVLDRVQQQLQASAGSDLSDEEQTFIQELQETIDQVKNDPNSLDQRVEEARQEGLTRIQEEQQQRLAELTGQLRKSRIRITLNSLLLAIGYFIILVNGARTPGDSRAKSKPKSKSRKSRKS